jgi:uncharacterized membrane protein required for colicin V production
VTPAVVWPDIAFFALILLAALRGLKRGFVHEVAGLIAIAVAIIAALSYRGMWDRPIANATDAGPVLAHWIGMGGYAMAGFAIASAAGWALRRVAKWPLIGVGDRLLGGVTGALKGVLLAWFIVYCLLFFPLGPHLRADLQRSYFIALIKAPSETLDQRVKATVPGFARPLTDPLFRAHHV